MGIWRTLRTIIFYIYIMDNDVDEEIDKIIEVEIIFSETLLDTAAINAVSLFGKNICPSPFWTSPLTGVEYTHELLACGPEGRIKEVLRMKKATFESLIAWAKRKNMVKASKNDACKEQLLMLLMVLNQGLWNCAIQEQFQHSG